MRSIVPMLCAAAIFSGCAGGPAWKTQTFAFASPPDPPAANAPTNLIALRSVSVSPLFRGRSFTYRISDGSYEQDPYAAFLVPPERALAEPIREWMRQGGTLGRFVESGSGLVPNLIAEASVDELCGDFHNPSQPVGAMKIHFVIYECNEGVPGRVVLDKACAQETPLARKTPAALMAAWDADLRQILAAIGSEYAKANINDGGR